LFLGQVSFDFAKHEKIQAIALAILSVSSIFAGEMSFDFKDPKGVNNIVFKLDAPLESISGTTNGISGTIKADPAQPENIEGKIIVDAKSLTVPNPMMQEHMLGAGMARHGQAPGNHFRDQGSPELKEGGKLRNG
jgi:polyisoprenoid-binding protein YceI